MDNNKNKIHVYFMPGLAASSKIFEHITLPSDMYELHYLSWLLPEAINESLDHYIQRLRKLIKHENSILIGVSFGGIIVQELAQIMAVRKIIIISSIKNLAEIPKRLKVLKATKAYKLFPAKTMSKIEKFNDFGFNKSLKKKSEMYNRYLDVRDEQYLNWAIYNVLHWQPKSNQQNIVHIHGSADGIFPIKHIKNSIVIEGGTHAMIITKAKKISKIIEENIH